jgi:hypothetical protein
MDTQKWKQHLVTGVSISKEDLENQRQEKEQSILKNKKYKSEWAKKQLEKDPIAFRAKQALHQRNWRAKNRGKARAISKRANEKYKSLNPELRKSQAQKYNHRLRNELIDFFGSQCMKCGYNDRRALQLDHINGGGGNSRKEHKETLRKQYVLMKNDPETMKKVYQLLCANCNCIKRVENYEYSKKARMTKIIREN